MKTAVFLLLLLVLFVGCGEDDSESAGDEGEDASEDCDSAFDSYADKCFFGDVDYSGDRDALCWGSPGRAGRFTECWKEFDSIISEDEACPGAVDDDAHAPCEPCMDVRACFSEYSN